jgi:YfiH family protein
MPDWFLSAQPGYARVAPASDGSFTPVAAFSTRAGGVSPPPFDSLNLSEGVGDDPRAVRENRRRLLEALGHDADRVAYATQVHGAHVLLPGGPGLAGNGDALVARAAGLGIVVGTADCLGLLAWDRSGRGVAAVHAGWRGIVAGVVERTLESLSQHGIAPSELELALGPRIGPCCFEVGPDVATRLKDAVLTGPNGRTTVDLAQAVRRRLEAGGVSPEAVRSLDECTSCGTGSWYSHRRDRGRTGRLWAIAILKRAGGRDARETAV